MNIIITQTKCRDASEFLYSELKKLLNNVDTIITNGNIACLLQDSIDYEMNEKNIEKPFKTPYSIGKYNNINILVDPYMKWSDNRIIVKNDDEIIDEIEIIDKEGMLI